MTEATSLAHRAMAERKKYEADAMQYQGEIADVRLELKITDERVSLLGSDRSVIFIVVVLVTKISGRIDPS